VGRNRRSQHCCSLEGTGYYLEAGSIHADDREACTPARSLSGVRHNVASPCELTSPTTCSTNHVKFRIYEAHFIFEFPFVHKQTIISSTSLELRLAFLAITSHHYSAMGPGRSTAYLKATLKHIGATYGSPCLEKIQALLMIGYHRWTVLQDLGGIGDIKLAIEYAEVMQCCCNKTRRDEVNTDDLSQTLIADEIRRRTFWSCYTLDVYLGSMAFRPRAVHTSKLALQLPCSNKLFVHGQDVEPRLLGEFEEEYQKRRCAVDGAASEADDDEALCRSIQILHVYGELLNLKQR
jgi:hypothetical protein